MEPETITHGAALLIGAILGAAGTLTAVFGRSETAKHELMERKFWPILQRVRAATGGRIGVVEDVPAHMANPPWWKGLPDSAAASHTETSGEPDEPYPLDDGEDYPRDEARVTHGAWRRETVRSDEQIAVWPANTGGAHRMPGEDTQDLTAYAERLRLESEVTAP